MRKYLGIPFVFVLLVLASVPHVSRISAQPSNRPEYVLVYVPLEWDASLSEFQRLCEQHTQWFVDKSGIGQYASVRVEYVGEVMRAEDLSADDLDSKVVKFGVKRVAGDVYIGLTDRDVGGPYVAGWTHFNGQGIVGEMNRAFVVAHELGHTFGLCDEYHFSVWSRQNLGRQPNGCPNPFPAQCDRSHNTPSYCEGTAAGNGYCIMGSSSQEETFCDYCQAALRVAFESRFGTPIAGVTATPIVRVTPATPIPPTAGPSPTPGSKLPPPPPTPTWPVGPTPQPGIPTQTARPPATPISFPTPLPSAYRITFVSEHNGLYQLYRLDESSHSLTLLYSASEPIYQPAVSPDGQRVAFVLAGADSWDIYLLEVASGEVKAVTDDPVADAYPAWLPDGRLAFVSEREGGYGLYEVPTATGAAPALLLRLAPGEYGPAFSPDGEVAVLSTQPAVYSVQLYSLSSGVSRSLVSGSGLASGLSWSAQGDQILYTVFGETRAELRAVSRDGTVVTLISGPANAAYGTWGLRAGEVVFASDADGDWEIYWMRLADGQVRSLTRNDHSDLYPMVSK